MKIVLSLGLLLASSNVVNAKERPQPDDQIVTDVISCRHVADKSERLECFDRTSKILADEHQAGDFVVVRKQDVKEAKRGLFGFSIPKIRLFAADDNKDEELKQINSTLAGVSGATGRYVFILPDGAVWAQTDGAFLRPPKVGQSILVKRGALGSFFAQIENGRAVRVTRRK